MVTGCAGCRRGAVRAWLGLCSVWVAINAAIERTRVVHAGPRHGWAVATLGGVGGGRVVACGRVVGVVAGLGEEEWLRELNWRVRVRRVSVLLYL